jgi:hypothetical protein
MKLFRVLLESQPTPRMIAADDWQSDESSNSCRFFAAGRIVATYPSSDVKGVETADENYNPNDTTAQEKSPFIDFTDYDK